MTGWKGRQIYQAPGKRSRSQVERLQRERAMVEIRETHRNLRMEFYERERKRAA